MIEYLKGLIIKQSSKLINPSNMGWISLIYFNPSHPVTVTQSKLPLSGIGTYTEDIMHLIYDICTCFCLFSLCISVTASEVATVEKLVS